MLTDIKSDIAKLLALYEAEKKRADEISDKLNEVQELNLRYKEQIAELTVKIDTMRLSDAFAATEGNSAARQRIDKLIREIDRCIKLLEYIQHLLVKVILIQLDIAHINANAKIRNHLAPLQALL